MPELIPLSMPHLGVSVTEGTVLAWHKQPGDAVREGEPVCDIATDKVDTEVVAPADCVITRLIAAVGETVAVGQPLAELALGEGAAAVPAPPAAGPYAESAPAAEPKPAEPKPAAEPEPAAEPAPAPAHQATTPVPRRFDPAAAAEAVVSRPGARNGDRISSPVARRIAEKHGVDIAAVHGSGMRGRVRKADVLAALESGPAAAASAPAGGLPRGYNDVPHRVEATTRRRRLIAEHMVRSRQTAAHMTTEAEVDMSAAARAREAINARRTAAGQGKVSYLALIARAACAALQEFPRLNSTFEMERHILWNEVNLGIAVDADEGLLVPVIRGCERLTAGAIADAVADLAGRARDGSISPEDLRAGTFTISNPGSLGGISAMAIINQPQVAILGIPAIVRRPAVVLDEHGEETIGIRPLMTLALTYDHRAVDGGEATRCVVRMKQLLESWDTASYG